MDQEQIRKKREEAEARRKKILERGQQRLAGISTAKDLSANNGDRRDSQIDNGDMIREPENYLNSSMAAQPAYAVPRSDKLGEAPVSTPDAMRIGNSMLDLVPNQPIASTSKGFPPAVKKRQGIQGSRKGARGQIIGGVLQKRFVALLVNLGMAVQYTRDLQVIASLVLGVLCGLKMTGNWRSPLRSISLIEVAIIGGGWIILSMSPVCMQQLVARRRALATLAQREGSNLLPSFLFSLPGISVWFTVLREMHGIIRSFFENLSIFVVAAGLIRDMGW